MKWHYGSCWLIYLFTDGFIHYSFIHITFSNIYACHSDKIAAVSPHNYVFLIWFVLVVDQLASKQANISQQLKPQCHNIFYVSGCFQHRGGKRFVVTLLITAERLTSLLGLPAEWHGMAAGCCCRNSPHLHLLSTGQSTCWSNWSLKETAKR